MVIKKTSREPLQNGSNIPQSAIAEPSILNVQREEVFAYLKKALTSWNDEMAGVLFHFPEILQLRISKSDRFYSNEANFLVTEVLGAILDGDRQELSKFFTKGNNVGLGFFPTSVGTAFIYYCEADRIAVYHSITNFHDKNNNDWENLFASIKATYNYSKNTGKPAYSYNGKIVELP